MATPRFFDETWGDGTAPREGFAGFENWLKNTPAAELQRRQQSAEAAFRQMGITFNVYGDEDAAERIIPFDIVPRIFLHHEWHRLCEGLEQRVRAINAFIDDIYGARRILADGVVPADIVLGNSQFCIPVAGARPPHGIYAHICGIDIVRTGADEFWVLEDNARTPSGVSYMLEIARRCCGLCPELFDRFGICPIDSYPELLRDTLAACAPPSAREPRCVLLTPGHFNSAFYEHSFLADNMGIELVEGRDLEVDDDRVWMRTTEGRVQVDVIYRRIDDDFSIRWCSTRARCWACRACSRPISPATSPSPTRRQPAFAGRQGDLLLTCRRSCRFIRARSRAARTVETWRCREPLSLLMCWSILAELVVKLVDGSGATACWSARPRQGARSSSSAPRSLRAPPLHRAADAGFVDGADDDGPGAGRLATSTSVRLC
jgi:uncharacterized circularly permuted ATP-grasp superfamily protein